MSSASGFIHRHSVKDLSVVIPAFKAERLVARTINSVLVEGVPQRNIIVVEDGCYDNTKKVMEEYPEVVFIRKKENEGAPKARNEGLRQVKTEFVMFLDSDDYVEGGLLKALVREISKNNSDIAFGPWRYDGENRDSGKIRLAPRMPASDWVFYWLLRSCVPTCSLIWRTSYVKLIGAWDERLKKNQDGELAIRALTRGAKISVTDEGCGIYWQHDSEGRVSNASVSDRLYASNILYATLLEWIKSNRESSSKEYEYMLGKYCCIQAWTAALGSDIEAMNFWFGRANQHGYTKKYYSKATMLFHIFGISMGAKFRSFVLSRVKHMAHS